MPRDDPTQKERLRSASLTHSCHASLRLASYRDWWSYAGGGVTGSGIRSAAYCLASLLHHCSPYASSQMPADLHSALRWEPGPGAHIWTSIQSLDSIGPPSRLNIDPIHLSDRASRRLTIRLTTSLKLARSECPCGANALISHSCRCRYQLGHAQSRCALPSHPHQIMERRNQMSRLSRWLRLWSLELRNGRNKGCRAALPRAKPRIAKLRGNWRMESGRSRAGKLARWYSNHAP